MNIRKAQPHEAPLIAPLLLLAMKDIFLAFIGTDSAEKATTFLTDLVAKPSNQYSYENCWVIENNEQIIGATTVYDGGRLKELHAPVKAAIERNFQYHSDSEAETQPGEIYIDCIGINPDCQGQGMGSELLKFLIANYVEKQKKTLGLLVDIEKPRAKKLYRQLGFKRVGKKILSGKLFEHMQLQP